MVARLGRVTVDLSATIEESSSPELVSLINSNVKPPEEISAGDVYIRAMYVVSDEVNSFGGRFPADELENVARLLIDSPVMVGHRKDKLPIARNFYARVERRGEQLWVKSYFYWLKNADNARDLQENIDGGIYKECSIGFTFHLAECSICSRDIRVCEHEPFKTYLGRNGLKSEPCRFDYRQIDRVLETSLVYRGALPNTSVTKELTAAASVRLEQPKRITHLSELKPEIDYLVTPCYEGLMVRVTESGQDRPVELLEESSIDIDPSRFSSSVPEESLKSVSGRIGQLVGYRGKERMNLDQLKRFLRGDSSAVTRIELKLFPELEQEGQHTKVAVTDRFLKVLRYRIVKGSELTKTIPTLMTRQGVRIWPSDQSPAHNSGYLFQPGGSEQIAGKYRLSTNGSDGTALFTLETDSHIDRFQIKGFDLNRMQSGRRFMADRLSKDHDSSLPSGVTLLTGMIKNLSEEKSCLCMSLTGSLNGSYRIVPARLNGEERFVIYRTDYLSVVGRT